MCHNDSIRQHIGANKNGQMIKGLRTEIFSLIRVGGNSKANLKSIFQNVPNLTCASHMFFKLKIKIIDILQIE